MTESFLKQKYIEEDLSPAEIASIAFSSRGTITRKLKFYKIPLKKVTRLEKEFGTQKLFEEFFYSKTKIDCSLCTEIISFLVASSFPIQ